MTYDKSLTPEEVERLDSETRDNYEASVTDVDKFYDWDQPASPKTAVRRTWLRDHIIRAARPAEPAQVGADDAANQVNGGTMEPDRTVWIPEAPAHPGLYANESGRDTDPGGKISFGGLQPSTMNPHAAKHFATREECAAWCEANPHPVFVPTCHVFDAAVKAISEAVVEGVIKGLVKPNLTHIEPERRERYERSSTTCEYLSLIDDLQRAREAIAAWQEVERMIYTSASLLITPQGTKALAQARLASARAAKGAE